MLNSTACYDDADDEEVVSQSTTGLEFPGASSLLSGVDRRGTAGRVVKLVINMKFKSNELE